MNPHVVDAVRAPDFAAEPLRTASTSSGAVPTSVMNVNSARLPTSVAPAACAGRGIVSFDSRAGTRHDVAGDQRPDEIVRRPSSGAFGRYPRSTAHPRCWCVNKVSRSCARAYVFPAVATWPTNQHVCQRAASQGADACRLGGEIRELFGGARPGARAGQHTWARRLQLPSPVSYLPPPAL